MANPQQPELARSRRGAVDADAVKEQLTAPQRTDARGDVGTVPEANRPGHHPDHEQDKPSGDAFVQKVHEHAREVDEPDASASDAETGSSRADDVARLATTPLRLAAGALRTVRDALPGD